MFFSQQKMRKRILGAVALLLAVHAAAQNPLPEYRAPQDDGVVSERGVPSRAIGAQLTLLVPDHTGLTRLAQPTLWWFASGPIEEAELSLWQGDIPVLTKPLRRLRAGLHSITVQKGEAHLQPGTVYEWRMRVQGEHGGVATVASGRIARQETRVNDDVSALARAGLWYDAIDAISRQIDRQPRSQQLRRQRVALLRQIGLHSVAGEDEAYLPLGLQASLPATLFHAGDPVWLTLACDKPCYLRITHLGADNQRVQVWPNAILQANLLPAGQPMRFPLPGSAMVLRASSPFGRESFDIEAASAQFPLPQIQPLPNGFFPVPKAAYPASRANQPLGTYQSLTLTYRTAE
ncbi:DUF928 domain-containing protein [Chitiniphilus eburneus]